MMNPATDGSQRTKISGGNSWPTNAAFPWSKLPRIRKSVGRLQTGVPQERYREPQEGSIEGRLAALISELTCIREKERKQIADDLHDHLGQNLVLATMKLGMLETSLPGPQRDMIQDLRQLIGQSLNQVRSLISGLHAHELRDLDFRAALEWLLQQIRNLYGLRCIPHISSDPIRLSHEDQETLLLAVRELLINVAKHAGVKEARVSVRCEDGKIVVLVADQGSGFDPKLAPFPALKSGGFGLISLRERMARIGGSFQLDSQLGKGTKATIALPVK